MTDRNSAASLFEPYAPSDPDSPRAQVSVRAAEHRDVEGIVEIWVDRNGGDPADLQRRWRRSLDEPSSEVLTLVAEVEGELAGYGKANFFHAPDEAPPNCAPAGWYLSGVSVARSLRRRGVGLALTRARLERLGEVANEVFYFANARNRVSIDLHTQLGFEPITEDFWYPRVSFEGGRGILFRSTLPAPKRSPD